jgi:hypothetical protein
MKLATLYAVDHRGNYKGIAQAQKMDYLPETFPALHIGQQHATQARYRIDVSNLCVIRPLACERKCRSSEHA